jgi:phospholipase/carboxylesterase
MLADNPHLAPPVTYAGAPLTRARAVAIVLHGRGQDPAVMAEQVIARLDRPDLAYVSPAAADHTWYPSGFMAPAADNEPRLTFALERVGLLADELAARGVPLAAQVLIGFTKGGCLA